MKKILRAAAALALAGCMMTANAFAATTFRDVPSNYWGKTFIDQAAAAGLVSGMGDGTYGVNGKLSSAQFTTMVCNLICKEDVTTYYNTYKPAEWWRSYMAVAYSKGYLKNTTVGDARIANNAWSTSSVNAEISRYDMAQIMINVASSQGWTLPSTTEVLAAQTKIADWNKIPDKYKSAVATAYAKQYLSGMDNVGTFAGEQSMTRTHGAVVICKLLNENKASNVIATPTFTNTTKLVNGDAATESNVVDALKALKVEYPNNTIWNLNSTYRSVVLGNGTGADAFTLMLADRVFGNFSLDVSEADELKPGDVVYFSDRRTHVLVTDVEDGDFYYVGCNASGKVSWSNSYAISDLTSRDTIYTRYEGEGDYSSGSSDGALSNGKAVTATNVKALMDQFLTDKYQVGDTWSDNKSHKSSYFKNRTVYGNEAFAYYLSDYVFGDLSVEEVHDYSNLQVGDVVYYEDWEEYLVVTKINTSSFGYVGVYEEEVYDGTMRYNELDSYDSAYTRYTDTASSGNSDGTLSNGKTATSSNVKALINKFLTDKYQVGDAWSDNKSHKSSYFKNRTVYGNEAFAYYLSDYVFGDLEVTEVYDVNDLRVGDVIYYDSWDEYLVITSISGDTLEIVGVDNEEVYEYSIDVDDLDGNDSAWTRYPDGSSSSSDKLSNGKAATASNVKALISKFMTDKYQSGDAWDDNDSYKSTCFKNRTVYGNEAFAYYLSDYVFGDLSVSEVKNFNNLRVGDVIYYDSWDEYLVVTKVGSGTIEFVGVYREEVYVDTMKVNNLSSSDWAYTRYPS